DMKEPVARGLIDGVQPRVTRRRGEVKGVGEAGGDRDEPDGLRFAVAVPGSFAGSRHAVAAAERRGEGEDGCERAEAWRVVTAWGRRANEAQRRRRSGYRHTGGRRRSGQMLVPEVLAVVAAAAPGAPRPGAPGRRTRVRLPTIQDPNRRMRQAVRRLTERPGAPGARRRGRVTATLVLTMVLGVAGLVLALRLREPAPPTVSYTELVRGIDDGRVAALEVVPGVGAEGRWAAPAGGAGQRFRVTFPPETSEGLIERATDAGVEVTFAAPPDRERIRNALALTLQVVIVGGLLYLVAMQVRAQGGNAKAARRRDGSVTTFADVAGTQGAA